MDASMPRAEAWPRPELEGWKRWTGAISACALAVVFLVAGVWKITDPLTWASLLTQALVPGALSIPGAIGFGIAETVAGVLLIVPRFRRWGAWLTGALLVAFMVYFGWNYSRLVGMECSCFPWIKRTVGPGFFIGDGVMLLLALAAGVFARRSEGLRSAAVIAGAVTVFAGVSLGVTVARQSGVEAPASIEVDGKPYSLAAGRVVIYFFDPECLHCYEAAKRLASHKWRATELVAVATTRRQFARQFLDDTGLRARLSGDLDLLRKTFPFTDPPYGVALEHGRMKQALRYFDEKEPQATLAALGYIE
jgi:uncharacterized membrane protein YphA (DoxX/SURF4 family)